MADGSAAVYLYVGADLARAAPFVNEALASTSERHALRVDVPPLQSGDIRSALSRPDVAGVLCELTSGLPTESHLQLLASAHLLGRRTWLYWPAEEAVECVDAERLVALRELVARVRWLKRIGGAADRMAARLSRVSPALRWIYRGEFPVRRFDIRTHLDSLLAIARPVQLRASSPLVALHVRADYWNAAASGSGSLLAALSTIADSVVSIVPSGEETSSSRVRVAAVGGPASPTGQDGIVSAAAYYRPIVTTACRVLRPAFVCDQFALGQYVAAEVCQTLRLPYIVEYAGQAAVADAALQGQRPVFDDVYARAEELALRQAAVVIVPTAAIRDEVVRRGVERSRVLVADADDLAAELRARIAADSRPAPDLETGDAYKDRVQDQWNENPVGSQYVQSAQPHSLEWFLEVERYRYGAYAPWMPEVMEFAAHRDEDVLEIGGGMGTDLAQFASHGARVTDVDLAAGHLQLAQENFCVRGLQGRFVHHDAESLPFDDGSFDVVYSNGVLHHTPNTNAAIAEIFRVLRPAGRVIVMLYAEDSLHYWRKLVWLLGIKQGLLDRMSMGEIMSRTVERSANDAKPLVKVYTPARAAAMFSRFESIEILHRQLEAYELPKSLRRWRAPIERRFGWNLIVKARKPR